MKKYIFILFSLSIIIFCSSCQSDINQEQNIVKNKHTNTETKVDTAKDYNRINENQNNQVLAESYITINKVGDMVYFGKYEQDNNMSNGKEKIEWICLCKEQDKALLISTYCLDGQPYNEEFTKIDWESSSLRKWLNSTFYDEAFSDEEKSFILDQEVSNGDEKIIMDKVSLPSIDEVNTYFDSMEGRIANFTDYAIFEREKNATSRFSDGWSDGWWLRTMSEKFEDCASDVAENGNVFSRVGTNVDCSLGVRPIIWVYI